MFVIPTTKNVYLLIIMSKFLSVFLLLISGTIFSQKNYSKEISFLSDNDLYYSLYQDKGYTSGLFLSYRLLKETSNSKVEKKIIKYQFGHMIFTPTKPTDPDLRSASLHSRPFAGYLFGEYGINRFYKNQDVFETNLQVGVIGSKSKSKEAQNFVHKLLGYPKAIGWKHQIKEAFALNFTGKYIKFLASDKSNHFDISSYNSMKFGTIFTDISTGFYTRIGFNKLQKLSNTNGLHSNLNKSKSSKHITIESFIYLKTMLSYVLYDATIQGSFLNTSSPVTFYVMPLKFNLEVGFRYSLNRFNYGYTIYYHTKKIKNERVKNSNIYGSIQISYMFR